MMGAGRHPSMLARLCNVHSTSTKPLELYAGLTRRAELAWRLGLALLSAFVLIYAYPPHLVPGLVFVGYAPLLLAIRDASEKLVFAVAMVWGTVAVSVAYAWVTHMAEAFMGIPPGASRAFNILLAAVQSCGPALALVLMVAARRHVKLPVIWAFPVFMLASIALYPSVFFYNLASASVGWTLSLQPIEVFGPWGLDFIICMTNAMAAEAVILLVGRWRGSQPAGPRTLLHTGIGLVVVVLWFAWAAILHSRWTREVASFETKKIGVVQPLRPKVLGPPPPAELEPYEFEISERLVAEGAEVLVWPEGRIHFYTHDPDVRAVFHEHVTQLGVPLVFNDTGIDLNVALDETQTQAEHQRARTHRYNGAHLIVPHEGFGGAYHKRKLVPFGEYIPVARHFESELEWRWGVWPGQGPVTWDVAGLQIVPAICYELIFPDLIAENIGPDARGRIVVVQSNDGWFGPGAQPHQHNAFAPLRAVENRVPVVHVINDGPSTATAPDGRVVWTSERDVRGGWVVEVPYDANSGGTVHGRHVGWFKNLVLLVFASVGALAFVRRRRGVRHPARVGEGPTRA